MKLNEAFPSNFLKAEDLKGRTVPCTIVKVAIETIGQGRDAEDKLVIAFARKEKQLICNKTNANTIAKLHGDDTDFWIGKVINIAPREVEFQGEMVWAIRVCLPAPGTTQAPATMRQPPAPVAPPPAPPAAAPQPSDNDGKVADDDVPF